MEKYAKDHPALLYQDEEDLVSPSINQDLGHVFENTFKHVFEYERDPLRFLPVSPSEDDLSFPDQEDLNHTLDEVLNTLPSFIISEERVQQNKALVKKTSLYKKRVTNFFLIPSLAVTLGASIFSAVMLGPQGVGLGMMTLLLGATVITGITQLIEKIIDYPLKKVVAGSASALQQQERLSLLATLLRMTNSPTHKKKLGQLSQFLGSHRVLDQFWENLKEETKSKVNEYRALQVSKHQLNNQDMLLFWSKQEDK